MNEEQEYKQETIDEIESQIKSQKQILKLSEGMAKIKEMPEYKEIFDELFLKAYRETSAYNVAVLSPDAKTQYMFQITARSIFERFVDGILQDGEISKNILKELEEELNEEKKLL